MWPFSKKPHLRYNTPEEWVAGEGISASFCPTADPAERECRFRQLFELKQHLWAKHIKTLSREDRKMFSQRTHPSQSHRFAPRAVPYIDKLTRRLAELGFQADVRLGNYHLDRIVLSADLTGEFGSRADELPWLFQGFEVKYHIPCRCAVTTQLLDNNASGYAKLHLSRISVSDDGWTKVLECPATGTRWKLEWPEGHLQGGGPMVLTRQDVSKQVG